MIFIRDLIGCITLFFVYAAIFLQIAAVYLISFEEDSLLFSSLKWTFYWVALWTIVAHLKSVFTDPGQITPANNPQIIEFYYVTRSKAIKAGKYETELLNQSKIQLIPENSDEYSDESELSENVQLTTSVSDLELAEYNLKFGLRLERCKNCSAARVTRTHHCRTCKWSGNKQLRHENGPSLHLDQQLCRPIQPEILLNLPSLRVFRLFDGCCSKFLLFCVAEVCPV